MRKRALHMVTAFSAGALAITGVFATVDANSRSTADIPPCVSEDSPGPCHWNASKRGNGEGKSFIVSESGDITHLTD